MRRFALSSLCLAALVLCGATLSADLSAASKPGGTTSRSGTITSFDKKPGRPTLATVALEPDLAPQPQVKVYGAQSMTVSPGMRVRLNLTLGTVFFAVPVGTVFQVSADGNTCVFTVDESQLDQTVEDPTSRTTVKVRDQFRVGAGVSVSR